jgi:4'-phosphopantetheinyl transferase
MLGDLEQGRVVVWLLPLSGLSDPVRRAYQRLLTPPELERAQRFLVEPPRDQFVAGRALLRSRLELHTGVPALEWQFAENDHGRPYVAEPKALRHIRFNLSHTDGLVACAISATHEIGVDVENTTRGVDFRDIAGSYFAPSEVADVRSRPDEQLRAVFFSYWTLKEAYIKGRGMGLALPLDCFWFDLDVTPPVLRCNSRCGDDPSAWQFLQLTPTDTHQLALGVRAGAGTRLDVKVRWADYGPLSGAWRPRFPDSS